MGVEDARAQRSSHGTLNTGLEGFRWRKVFRKGGTVDISLLKKLDLTPREMVRWKTLSANITRYDPGQWAATGSLQRSDAEQRSSTAGLQKRLEKHKGLAAKGLKKNKADSNNSNRRKKSSPKTRVPKNKCKE